MNEDQRDLDHLSDFDDAPSAEEQQSLESLARQLLAARDASDAAEAAAKEAKGAYDRLRKAIVPDALAKAGVSGLKLATGEQLYLTTKVDASVLKELRPTLYAWLRDNGHADLVVDYVHPQTLTAFVKELRDRGAELPPMVSLFTEQQVAVRGRAKES